MTPTTSAEAPRSVLRHIFSLGEDDGTAKAAVFLVIADEGSCTSKYIERALGIDQSTVSRVTRALGDGPDRHGGPGRQLIRRYPDPLDTNRLRFEITEAGCRYLAMLEQQIVQAAATILHSRVAPA